MVSTWYQAVPKELGPQFAELGAWYEQTVTQFDAEGDESVVTELLARYRAEMTPDP